MQLSPGPPGSSSTHRGKRFARRPFAGYLIRSNLAVGDRVRVIGISRAPFLNGMQAIVTESLGESRWAVRSVDPDPQRGRMFLDSVHAESGFSTENLIKIHRDFSQMKWKQ